MSDNYEISAKISGDSSGFTGALEHAMKGLESWGLNVEKMSEEGGQVFKKFGVDVDAFAGKIGVGSPMLLGIAAVGAALFELGKQAFEVGMVFDEAFADMGKATGKTGLELREFGDDLVKVIGSGVEQDVGDVSSAFALLSQKLDVTGDALVALTVDFTKFADVTHQSVTDAVKGVTQVMNQWNIETEDAIILMDQLTKAAQITGKPVSEITEAVNAGAARFKQLGLSLTDSIGFLTAFTKAGADTSITTNGLNAALVNLSAKGGDIAESFRDAIAEIRSAKDPQEALNAGVELFGSRAAPRMVDALRNAKFDLQGFTAEIEKAGGTVEKTAEGTQGLGEKWAEFGNKVMAAVAPIGEVLVKIAGFVTDVFGVAFEQIQLIVRPIFEIIQALFRGMEDTVKSVFGTVGALIRGDWATAWKSAELVVLDVAKAILDISSGIVNTVTGFINAILTPMNSILTSLGQKAIQIAKADLSELSGISKAIKGISEDLEKSSEKSTKELGVQSDAREKIINDEAKTYEISIQDRIAAAKELQEAYRTQQQAERALTALTLQTANASERAAQTFAANAALISGTIDTLVSGPFYALGQALKTGENLWGSFAQAALHSIAMVVKAFGDQMAAKAALDLAQAIAYASNPFTVLAAPGYYAQAAIEFGAATAAYTAAGVISAFEDGTEYAPGGYALVGERGPEIVHIPQGAQVKTAGETASMMKSAKGATINFNIGQMTRDSVGATMRQATVMARQLAFQGVL